MRCSLVQSQRLAPAGDRAWKQSCTSVQAVSMINLSAREWMCVRVRLSPPLTPTREVKPLHMHDNSHRHCLVLVTASRDLLQDGRAVQGRPRKWATVLKNCKKKTTTVYSSDEGHYWSVATKNIIEQRAFFKVGKSLVALPAGQRALKIYLKINFTRRKKIWKN